MAMYTIETISMLLAYPEVQKNNHPLTRANTMKIVDF